MRIGVRFLLPTAVSALSVFAQAPKITAVDNGFSFKSHISPGVLASIFGSDLSGSNLEVTVQGQSCPVTYSSASQLNIQVPWDVSTGAGSVIVTHDNLTSKPFKVMVSEYSPALASLDGSGSGIGEFFTPNGKLITTTNPANAGDTLVTFAVGLGATNPSIATGETTPNPPPFYVTVVSPAITVGGKAAKILFSGLAPGELAIDQLNFALATDTTVGTDTVTLTAGSSSSSAITIPIACLDSTAGVSVTEGPLENPSANKYTQKVTIQNTSGKRLAAKGSLILTSLTSSAQLTNGGGKSCPSSDGSPYKSFTFTGTDAAQTATVTLDFTDSSTGTITYGQRVLTK